jgi:hypothetical protein
VVVHEPPAPEHTPMPFVGVPQSAFVQQVPAAMHIAPHAMPFAMIAGCVQLPLPSQMSFVHGLLSVVHAVPATLLICGFGSHSQISPVEQLQIETMV